MRERGFTLLELLITVTIMTLLLAVGLPSLSQQIQNNRTKAATMALYESVQLARTTAISNNSRATLRYLNSWEDGWEVFVDENHNGVRDESERLISVYQPPTANVSINANSPVQRYVSFIGTGESRYAKGQSGGAFQAGTFTICPERGEGYSLVLSRGGRMRISRVDVGDCETTS